MNDTEKEPIYFCKMATKQRIRCLQKKKNT